MYRKLFLRLLTKLNHNKDKCFCSKIRKMTNKQELKKLVLIVNVP